MARRFNSRHSSTSFKQGLAAFFNGGGRGHFYADDLVTDEEEDNNNNNSSANQRFHRLARRIGQIKAVMLVTALLLALLAFTGLLLLLLLTTPVVFGRLTEDQASEDLFWLTTTELKRPFQHRLTEQLRNEGGVGIKTKLGGGAQCLAVAYSSGARLIKTKKVGGTAHSACPTRFNRFAANRTLHLLDGGLVRDCLYCGPPAAGCRPRVEWCKAGAVTFGEVSPGVAAVDVHQGALYFALYSLKLPFQCAGRCPNESFSFFVVVFRIAGD